MSAPAEADKMETYLELSCPKMCWRVVNQAAGKISLDATDEIMVFGVRALPNGLVSLMKFTNCAADTHDMIPKAWYSMIDDREMRAKRPCCIPRSKRTMATFGDGCGSVIKVTLQAPEIYARLQYQLLLLAP